MASIEIIKGSDGSGNANLATVQSTRSPLASTIIVDTVLGINPAGFAGTMGTPHTFTDPITSETITVISEATAVDFVGHVDGSNLEIDTIAPGYTDAGSEVGDIVIIRPTTQYADNLAETLEVVHEDDGTLKDDVVDTAQIADGAVETAQLLAHAATVSRLDAVESTDLFTGGALTAATWTDFKGNQNFTVDSTDSIILVAIRGCAQIPSTSTATNVASRIIIDSAGTPTTKYVGGANGSAANAAGNPFAGNGFVILTGLSAGVHTIKTQVYSASVNSIIYCRCSTQPNIEFFTTEVLELKR